MRQWMFLLSVGVIVVIVSNGCGETDEPVLPETEVRFSFQIPQQTPFSQIASMTVTVTAGPNDETILATIPLTIQDNTATGKASIFAGKNRVFTLEAKDKDGTLIGSGVATEDIIAGETVTVSI